jgi:SAM-dependent methyltransferase
VAAFAEGVEGLDPGAQVLDCACGTGQLAVGLALRGLRVTATDASTGMIERTRALAAAHGVDVEARAVAWEALSRQGWGGRFDAVFCVGNSLVHAAGTDARRAALRAMRGVLRPGGTLVVTSRNWERVRALGSRLEVGDRLVRREPGAGLVIRAWTIPADWEAAHHLDTAVAVLGDRDAVSTRSERLRFWPFPAEALDADLRAAGLEPVSSTFAPDAERYAVRARRPR